jgi:hypothetical protein
MVDGLQALSEAELDGLLRAMAFGEHRGSPTQVAYIQAPLARYACRTWEVGSAHLGRAEQFHYP